ncbi:MAG TPA: oxaloacetate decarboxylase, partial [Bryobacteraceae bacterium]|nr:oxaloacetate decarboxylase [Bryobacteraceae bacterium]
TPRDMRKTTLLKKYIHDPEILVIPGVPDPLCARIASKVGFKAVFVSGCASSAATLGAPDVGLMTMTEMVECAARIVDAVDIPVFADGDTGHGNVTNLIRSMRQFEKAGVAAIFFEDQVAPKRCGHMSGKQVVPIEEMLAKIKAAVDTRIDADLMVMARTDALAMHGIDEAIARMQRYIEAGADMAFIEAPQSIEQMRQITSAIKAPNMANMVPGGKTPILPAKQLEEIGFAVVAHPTALTYAMAKTAQDVFRHIRDTGTSSGLEGRMVAFEEFNDLVGLPEIRAKEREYLSGLAEG